MNYTLPKAVTVGGLERSILWDYRPMLDILVALDDPELEKQERIFCAMCIFYPELDAIEKQDIQEAADKMFWFINGGEDEKKTPGPRIMDWEQDFKLIAAPVNRVLGRDIRSEESLHWWSFLSAYYEIGECTFAQVIRIREMRAKGEKMQKADREWYNRHRELVDIKSKYTRSDMDILKNIIGA